MSASATALAELSVEEEMLNALVVTNDSIDEILSLINEAVNAAENDLFYVFTDHINKIFSKLLDSITEGKVGSTSSNTEALNFKNDYQDLQNGKNVYDELDMELNIHETKKRKNLENSKSFRDVNVACMSTTECDSFTSDETQSTKSAKESSISECTTYGSFSDCGDLHNVTAPHLSLDKNMNNLATDIKLPSCEDDTRQRRRELDIDIPSSTMKTSVCTNSHILTAEEKILFHRNECGMPAYDLPARNELRTKRAAFSESDVSVKSPVHKKRKIGDKKVLKPTSVWQKSSNMENRLARRNFINPLGTFNKCDGLTIVLDTRKPNSPYKYPVNKPTYTGSRQSLQFGNINPGISLTLTLNAKHRKENPLVDDYIELSDSLLTHELNREYKKVMQVDSFFCSPNRIIAEIKDNLHKQPAEHQPGLEDISTTSFTLDLDTSDTIESQNSSPQDDVELPEYKMAPQPDRLQFKDMTNHDSSPENRTRETEETAMLSKIVPLLPRSSIDLLDISKNANCKELSSSEMSGLILNKNNVYTSTNISDRRNSLTSSQLSISNGTLLGATDQENNTSIIYATENYLPVLQSEMDENLPCDKFSSFSTLADFALSPVSSINNVEYTNATSFLESDHNKKKLATCDSAQYGRLTESSYFRLVSNISNNASLLNTSYIDKSNYINDQKHKIEIFRGTSENIGNNISQMGNIIPTQIQQMEKTALGNINSILEDTSHIPVATSSFGEEILAKDNRNKNDIIAEKCKEDDCAPYKNGTMKISIISSENNKKYENYDHISKNAFTNSKTLNSNNTIPHIFEREIDKSRHNENVILNHSDFYINNYKTPVININDSEDESTNIPPFKNEVLCKDFTLEMCTEENDMKPSPSYISHENCVNEITAASADAISFNADNENILCLCNTPPSSIITISSATDENETLSTDNVARPTSSIISVGSSTADIVSLSVGNDIASFDDFADEDFKENDSDELFIDDDSNTVNVSNISTGTTVTVTNSFADINVSSQSNDVSLKVEAENHQEKLPGNSLTKDIVDVSHTFSLGGISTNDSVNKIMVESTATTHASTKTDLLDKHETYENCKYKNDTKPSINDCNEGNVHKLTSIHSVDTNENVPTRSSFNTMPDYVTEIGLLEYNQTGNNMDTCSRSPNIVVDTSTSVCSNNDIIGKETMDENKNREGLIIRVNSKFELPDKQCVDLLKRLEEAIPSLSKTELPSFDNSENHTLSITNVTNVKNAQVTSCNNYIEVVEKARTCSPIQKLELPYVSSEIGVQHALLNETNRSFCDPGINIDFNDVCAISHCVRDVSSTASADQKNCTVTSGEYDKCHTLTKLSNTNNNNHLLESESKTDAAYLNLLPDVLSANTACVTVDTSTLKYVPSTVPADFSQISACSVITSVAPESTISSVEIKPSSTLKPTIVKSCSDGTRSTSAASREESSKVRNDYATSKTSGIKRPAPASSSDNEPSKRYKPSGEIDRSNKKIPTISKNYSKTKETSYIKDPRWALYNFSCPEDCFEVVRTQWCCSYLPNPHQDLTCRFSEKFYPFSSNFVIPGNKTQSIIECLTVYDEQIDKVKYEMESLKHDLDSYGSLWERRKIRLSIDRLNKLRDIHGHLLKAHQEAYHFYKYYQDPNTGWNAWYISNYKKNEVAHQLKILDTYETFYGYC